MIRHSTNPWSANGSKNRSQSIISAHTALQEAGDAHNAYALSPSEKKVIERAMYSLSEDKIAQILAMAACA
jgi:hypothetical protein